ncbi:MAG: hypothetical protein ACOYM2_16580 [Rectinemataceae bacterium]
MMTGPKKAADPVGRDSAVNVGDDGFRIAPNCDFINPVNHRDHDEEALDDDELRCPVALLERAQRLLAEGRVGEAHILIGAARRIGGAP